jgi:hypothetical protein
MVNELSCPRSRAAEHGAMHFLELTALAIGAILSLAILVAAGMALGLF